MARTNKAKFYTIEEYETSRKESKSIYYKEYSKDRLETRKQQLRDKRDAIRHSHGDKCAFCGYNRNIAALEFHHLEPKEKYAINTYEEANKCILLCANCHREYHFGGLLY
jgi:5-methylcytosine-specific restriction endonuclease McrA